jgi:hypothetical protein
MDWADLWKMLGAIGLTGAVSAWFGGYLGGFLPPPPRLVRAIRHTARTWVGRPARLLMMGATTSYSAGWMAMTRRRERYAF